MTDTSPTEKVAGEEVSTKSKVLETGAALLQDFSPVKSICAHLNAFHAYASDPSRHVETNHYCSHVTEDVRQCLLYDSPHPNARLLGVEYMITPKLYETLDPSERRLWHSHVYEVKSGMLVMPLPPSSTHPSSAVASATGVWERAETAEMKDVVHLYGKVYHLWQVDRGDKLPLGEPQLMTSYVADGQLDFDTAVAARDEKFGIDYRRKREIRKGIEEPEIHPDADYTWKKDK